MATLTNLSYALTKLFDSTDVFFQTNKRKIYLLDLGRPFKSPESEKDRVEIQLSQVISCSKSRLLTSLNISV